MDRPARLTIESARESDGGRYRCRVDFKSSPTRNSRVDLSIIVPPENVVILDDKGFHVPNRVLGPYDEDASPDIVCIVKGGRPPPKVTWWRDGLLLDDSYEALPGGRARNLLQLERLQRSHADAQLTCQASNNELVAPATASVTIDLNLEPLWVRLVGDVRPLSADSSQEVQCEVVGARPAPGIAWWLADTPLRNTRETTSRDRNVTTSTVTFVPSLEDSGKTLTCRAGSADVSQEDSWLLDILHVPIVSLELGSNINSSHIREGMDVYFDCSIKSNPWVYKVSWRHNGKPMSNNVTAGTIVTNQSLVLQSVSRSRGGIYTCVASNQEGDGESNPIYLDIKYAPACRAGQRRVLSVARHQTARVVCLVDANPARVHFSWRFNNSAELVDIPASHISSDRTRSVASYVPVTALDYGTLLCSGRNDMGAQRTPCAFHVVPAGKPEPPANCTVANQTAEALQVECTAGGGGGLPQLFVMEVVDAATGELLANTTSSSPTLVAAGLPHGAGLNVSVYSANGSGRSDPASLPVPAVRPQETRTGPDARPQPPAKCSLARRTASEVWVSCEAPADAGGATYLLQAFDAGSRRLVGSATSPAAGRIELSGLPAGQGALLLSVRTVTARATSDAATVFAAGPGPRDLPRRDMQELLQLTPALGAAVGALATLLVVGAAVAVTLRLRRRCKDAAKAPGAAAPASKDQDEAAADDNNPDVIPPRSTDKCHITDEEAFEMMPTAPKVIFKNVDSPLQFPRRGSFKSIPESEEQLIYVQLCQPRPMFPPSMQHVGLQQPVVLCAHVDVARQSAERKPSLHQRGPGVVVDDPFATLPHPRRQVVAWPASDAAVQFPPPRRARRSSADDGRGPASGHDHPARGPDAEQTQFRHFSPAPTTPSSPSQPAHGGAAEYQTSSPVPPPPPVQTPEDAPTSPRHTESAMDQVTR